MMPYYEGEGVTLHHGDMRLLLAELPADSLPACVCDPPYELGFMGKSWDSSGIAFQPETWAAVYRVLMPGAHLLAFGGDRTHHRLACAIEDAGFEIRTTICWAFGSGFPKSLDISKSIDRAAGAERELGPKRVSADGTVAHDGVGKRHDGWERPWREDAEAADRNTRVSYPATALARQWDGWGTALKPCVEFITLARKPLSEPNVAANVTRWGTGGLNIGACRIGHNEACRPMAAQADSGKFFGQAGRHAPTLELKPEGRWPGNLILQTCGPTCGESCAPGCAVAEMDRQSGESRSSGREIRRSASLHDTENGWGMRHAEVAGAAYGDTGTASRFFACIEPDAPFQYVPKPSRSERDQGCGELPDQTRNRVNPGGLENDPRWAPVVAKNTHATVKPVNLLSYLCRLICPPGGTVLDPFAGSGSTGVACIREGFGFLGMELEREHCEIAEARLRDARSRYSREFGKRTPQPVRKRPTERTPQPSLFDLLEAE